jgi:hypothetical protein
VIQEAALAGFESSNDRDCDLILRQSGLARGKEGINRREPVTLSDFRREIESLAKLRIDGSGL